ncbi:hypothetical protein F5884DRAFT_456478 [Xylogone sp. PMI_703]|nr:hypothetical protein F5884DRAFT_456478 [Xylogone sp. PMI_703]
MDEAGRLVEELQRKLAELDRRVWSYRRDMASEFSKYARGLLHQVPKDVSDAVSKTIAVSLKDYKSLNPDNDILLDLSSANSSPPSPLSTAAVPAPDLAVKDSRSGSKAENNDTKAGPSVTAARDIPVHQQRLAVPEEDPLARSPHEREEEFHGLFTPMYLPLLDAATNGPARRSSYDSYLAPGENNITSKEKENRLRSSSGSSSGSNTNGNSSAMYSNTSANASAPADLPSMATAAGAADVTQEKSRPATPQRRNTDEASIGSDDSRGGVPTRRSALRRSSSGSTTKTQSPRKVRFELEGQEVFPTVEPAIQESPLELASPTVSSVDDDDSYNGSMLEMIEDVDEPPPKRVSSSQALLAMSRAPLEEDGTTWTTVTSPPEEVETGILDDAEVPEVETVEDVSSEKRDGSSLISPSNTPSTPRDTPRVRFDDNPEILESSSNVTNDESTKYPEVGIVNINVGYKKPTAAELLEPLPTREAGDGKSHPLSPNKQDRQPSKSSNKDAILVNDEEDDEDLFLFDDGTDPASPSRTTRPQAKPETEPESPEEEEEEEEDEEEEEAEPVALSQYSQSPARPIMRPIFLKSAATPAKDVVGSYKGHPFSVPIVSDEIHRQAASLGALNSFVGSIKDVSDLDLRRLRAGAAASFSGTPKSLSERMMMEDLMEAAEEAA